MTVHARAGGKGIGLILGKAILTRAEFLGAKRVYLETNSILKPAVNLYRKLGFQPLKAMHRRTKDVISKWNYIYLPNNLRPDDSFYYKDRP